MNEFHKCFLNKRKEDGDSFLNKRKGYEKRCHQVTYCHQQSEIPFDVIERNIKLPVNRKKIITVPGVRRCGKSTLMEIAVNELVREGKEIHVAPAWKWLLQGNRKGGGMVLLFLFSIPKVSP